VEKRIKANVYTGIIVSLSNLTLWAKVEADTIEELEDKVARITGVDKEIAKVAVRYSNTPVLVGYLEPFKPFILQPDVLPSNLRRVRLNLMGDYVYEDDNGYWWPFYIEVARK
jgi:hypothetical protein